MWLGQTSRPPGETFYGQVVAYSQDAFRLNELFQGVHSTLQQSPLLIHLVAEPDVVLVAALSMQQLTKNAQPDHFESQCKAPPPQCAGRGPRPRRPAPPPPDTLPTTTTRSVSISGRWLSKSTPR